MTDIPTATIATLLYLEGVMLATKRQYTLKGHVLECYCDEEHNTPAYAISDDTGHITAIGWSLTDDEVWGELVRIGTIQEWFPHE